jgi:hypothetical protein
MNLDLDTAQRWLAASVGERSSVMPENASGWAVLDAVGVTDLMVPASEGVAALGLFEWCLVFEELGTNCRDIGDVRAARSFVDDSARSPNGPVPVPAAVGSRRAPRSLPDVAFEPEETLALADRDLLMCASYAVGVGRRCLELAQERADERVVAGRRLIEHQGVAHRLARSAFDLADARVGLWRVVWHEDQGSRAGHRAPAVTAGCVSVALDCAHEVVQMFGAAGTSDRRVVRLYRTAYGLPRLCGTPRELWRSAGARSLDDGTRPA